MNVTYNCAFYSELLLNFIIKTLEKSFCKVCIEKEDKNRHSDGDKKRL